MKKDRNRTCKNPNCDIKYYACPDSIKRNSWRAHVCSVKCWKGYIEALEKEGGKIGDEIK